MALDLLFTHLLAALAAAAASRLVIAMSNRNELGWWAAALVCLLFTAYLVRATLRERREGYAAARALAWLGVVPQGMAVVGCALVACIG